MSDYHGYAPRGSGEKVYAEDLDPRLGSAWADRAFNEETDFRQRMKSLEEYALSGEVTKPKASFAGINFRVVHRIGDRYDVQINDPFARKARTVVSHQYDSLGRRKATWTAWRRGDPESVAKVFDIPFVSAFGDMPGRKPQEVRVREATEAASARVTSDYAREGAALLRKDQLRKEAEKYEHWVKNPRRRGRIPPEIVAILKEMGKWR